MTTFERVGFIGLGGMGRGLVKNLVAKGVAVTVYDLNPAAIAVATSFGATAAGNLQEIRDSCRIIMICVNEAEDVEALLMQIMMMRQLSRISWRLTAAVAPNDVATAIAAGLRS